MTGRTNRTFVHATAREKISYLKRKERNMSRKKKKNLRPVDRSKQVRCVSVTIAKKRSVFPVCLKNWPLWLS